MSIFSAIIGGAANAVKTVVSNVAKTVSAQSQSSSSGSSSSSSSYSPPAYTPPTYNPPTYSNSYSSSNHSYTTQKSYAASGSGGASNTSKGSSSSNEPQTNSPMFTRQDAREYLDEVEFITKTQEAQTQDEIESEQQQQEVLSKALESTVNAAKEMVDKILHPDNKGDKEAENTEAEESEDIEQKQKAEAQQAKEEKEEKEEKQIKSELETVSSALNDSLDDITRNDGNGKIDADFSQGSIGDCQFLAIVYSLAQSDRGKQALDEAIQVQKDSEGNVVGYNIYFAGLNETYTVTREEVDEATEQTDVKRTVTTDSDGNIIETIEEAPKDRIYSRGDDDMTALELAFEKACINSTNPEFRTYVDISHTIVTIDENGNVIYSDNKREPEENGQIDYLKGVDDNAVLYAFGLEGNIAKEYEYGAIKDDFMARSFMDTKDGQEFIAGTDGVTLTDTDGNEIEFDSFERAKLVEMTDDTFTIEQKSGFFGKKEEVEIEIQEAISEIYDWTGDIITPDREKFDKKLDDIQNENIGGIVLEGLTPYNNTESSTFYMTNSDGEQVEIFRAHAYALKEVNGDIITLVNPHDTSTDIKITRDELYNLSCFRIRYPKEYEI